MPTETQRFSLDEVNKALEQVKPYLLIVEQCVQELKGNGIASFDIRIHQGKPVDVVVKHVKRIVL